MSSGGAVLVLVTGLQGTGKSAVAEGVAEALGAPVFAWDWFMGALTPFAIVQDAFQSMDKDTYRAVGWAMVRQQARAQLGRGLSVVLDGMARDDDIATVRALADELDIRSVVVMTTCNDPQVQRSRIESRARGIPGWHELTWDHVSRSRQRWVRPHAPDIELDETATVAQNVAKVLKLLGQS